MKNPPNISNTESPGTNQLMETIPNNKRKRNIISTADSEINTTSLIQQGQARFQELLRSISCARAKEDNHHTCKPVWSRIPPKWIHFEPSKFVMRRVPESSSMYFEEPEKPQKTISWCEANNSRPALKFDMDGPGPCTYSPRNKLPTETNAPAYSFGVRYASEKALTAIDQLWDHTGVEDSEFYASAEVYRSKTLSIMACLQPNHLRNTKRQLWPSPNSYSVATILGTKQATLSKAPAYTFGHRRELSFVRQDVYTSPSPNEYSRQKADSLIMSSGPSFTLQFRRDGTVLWNTTEQSPGPAAYSPVVLPKIRKPAYTMQGVRSCHYKKSLLRLKGI